MLPDRYRELLAASVDGELTGRQRRRVDRLLHRSEPARLLLRQLQDDALGLRQLPRPALPGELSGRVLQAIADRRLTPGRRRPVKLRPAFPAWAGLAAAAAVLLVLGSASYIYFASSLPAKAGGSLAQHGTNPKDGDREQPERSKDGLNPAPTPPVVKGPGETPRDNQPAPADPDPLEKDPFVQAPAPTPMPPESDPDLNPPRDPPGPVFGDGRMEIFELQMVQTSPLLVLPLLDLDNDVPRQKVLTELDKGPGFRMELPCVDGSRAFERLQAACKSAGVSLVLDPLVATRLKKPHWRTSYVLVLENQSPRDLLQLLRKLGAADRQAAARKSGDAQFDRLVIAPLKSTDRRELADILGIEPAQVQTPKPSQAPTLDPKKPLPDQTGPEVARALAGQGGNPRPDGSKPAAKPAEGNPALALTLPPVRPARPSPEVKRFLDGRKPNRAGTIQVMLVLRTVGS